MNDDTSANGTGPATTRRATRAPGTSKAASPGRRAASGTAGTGGTAGPSGKASRSPRRPAQPDRSASPRARAASAAPGARAVRDPIEDTAHPDAPVVVAPRREGVVVLASGRGLGYAEFGDLDGRPVLWFHGTPGARRQVPPDLDAEARARGFRVIGIDRPGTGLSTPYHYERVLDFADDVAALADQLGFDRFATVGLSGGGPYVLACCAALPDRVRAGAVLGGVGPTKGKEAAPGYTRLLPPIEPLLRLLRIPLGELLTHLVRPARAASSVLFDAYTRVASPADRPVMRRPEVKALFLDDICSAAEGGLRAPLADLLVFGRDWGFRLADIGVPVRFWHGDADGIVPLSHGEFQAAAVPGATLVVCPGGGHFAGFMLAADVLDWIDSEWRLALPAGA